MTTKQTAEQLELAAQILRTWHPWEVHLNRGWQRMEQASPLWSIANDCEIRPILATPPDGRPLHNPDNLTAEQVGVGYRLMLLGEKTNLHTHLQQKWKGGKWSDSGIIFKETIESTHGTYRLPLSVPWPEPQPDPYAELKKAHAEGKVIQAFGTKGWYDTEPTWSEHGHYRIKPTPTFQLPPPPPGMQWHRTDGWKEGDLPQGMRPLVANEDGEVGDEWFSWTGQNWKYCNKADRNVASTSRKHRTRRPLTFTHAGKQWTWHRPGDPMPCEPGKLIDFIDTKKAIYRSSCPERHFEDYGSKYPWPIIGWRYADEKKTVPQDSAFFLPSTAIRFPEGSDHWSVVATLGSHGLIVEEKLYLFQELFDLKAMANRSIPLTGKWNPDSWEPCHKLISKNG